MDMAGKLAKTVAYFSKIEEVSGKKVLDFLGELVHNREYRLGGTNGRVAKHTGTVEQGRHTRRKRGPGGMEAAVTEYIEGPD